MRIVSDEFKREVNAPETAEKFLELIEIGHDSLDDTLYFVANDQPITSNGNTYVPIAFKLTLPNDSEGQLPTAKIEIDNVDRAIGVAIRQMATKPSFKIKVVKESDPDVIEVEFNEFSLSNATYDMMTVSGELAISNYYNQTYPKDNFNASRFPGLF